MYEVLISVPQYVTLYDTSKNILFTAPCTDIDTWEHCTVMIYISSASLATVQNQNVYGLTMTWPGLE